MDKIVKEADDTGFQISIEKTKAIMFSRKNTTIASRPRLDIWIKGTTTEQVRKHKILGSIFDTTMTGTNIIKKGPTKKIFSQYTK
jgi:hypothetical protein